MNQALTKKTNRSSQLIKQWKFTPTSIQTASDNCGFDKSKVEFLAEILNEPLRLMNPQTAIVELTKQIPLIGQEYGVYEAIPSNVISESIKIIMTRHSDLNIWEIREAYREYVDGGLFKDDKVAETFKGKFSVKQIGRILRQYKKKRNKIKSALINAAEAEESKRLNEEMKIRKQQRFEEKFNRELLEAKTKFTSWKDVPSYWWDVLKSRNKITFEKGQKRNLWIHACEVFGETENLTKHHLNEVELEVLRDGYNREFSEEEVKKIRESKIKNALPTAINISQKLFIFHKIVKSDSIE